MSDSLENHERSVSIGSRAVTNLRFVDDIDALAATEHELEALLKVSIKSAPDME